MSGNEKVAELLENAAQLLEKQGWVKGHLHREYSSPIEDDVAVIGHRFCAAGAIRCARAYELYGYFTPSGTEDRLTWLAESLLVSTIYGENWNENDEFCGSIENAIFTWNDNEDREKAEVLDSFHAAAKQALGVGPDDA